MDLRLLDPTGYAKGKEVFLKTGWLRAREAGDHGNKNQWQRTYNTYKLQTLPLACKHSKAGRPA